MILAPTLSLSAGSGAAIVRPAFSRDFAGEKTLNNGTGPAITFTRASDATYFDANGTLQTAGSNVPRFDHSGGNSLGLLIEEQRTNSIINSQASGATVGVIGSGGAEPTNWAVSAPSGITQEVVATGTVNGMNYVDVRWSGTRSGGATFLIQILTGNNVISASSGQTWTGSMYVALVGGSYTNITDSAIRVVERNAGGSPVAGTSAAFTATSSLARGSVTRTYSDATTARTTVQYIGTVADGATIDITLRIAAPQLEQGAFATSYIPTTTAAATRSADSAVVTPISSFYNQAEGTLFAEASSNDSTASRFSTPVGVGSSNNDRIYVNRNSSTSQGRVGINVGGVAQAATDVGAWTLGAFAKIATAFKTDDVAATINGASVTTDTSATMPTADTLSIGGPVVASSTFTLNGHIRKIAYYPKRLTDALLQQLTT